MFLKCLLILSATIQTGSEPDRRLITTLKYSRNYVRPAVVNGKLAVSGQIPYMVSIKEPWQKHGIHKYVWRNLCGGSIISKLKVLTAAHCFERNNFYYMRKPNILYVVAGNSHNRITYTDSNTTTQWRKIDKLVLHTDFHFPHHDIAIFSVDPPWIFGFDVNYIVPARKTIDYPRTCVVAGFGKIGFGPRAEASQDLLLAPIRIMSRSQCSLVWEMNMNGFICSDSLVADVAKGDSGGPLACKWTSDPAEKKNRDLLVGVVSGKNFDYTTIFTRVSEYREWIARSSACSLSCRIHILFSITPLLVIYVEYFFDFT